MMNAIISSLNSVASFFYELYLEVLSWPYPLWKGSDLFYQLHRRFNSLAWAAVDLREWIDFASDRLEAVLSWGNLRGLIRGWLPGIERVVSWWEGWRSAVWRELEDWWSATRRTAQGWIEAGDQGLRSLIEDARAWLAGLQATADTFLSMLPTLSELGAWFRDWRGQFLATLGSWWVGAVRDVQGLIDSAFVSREPFWAGWQDVRGGIFEFVGDPWEWLEEKFAGWFLGPEE